MKSTLLITTLVFAIVTTALAEMEFPEYDGLSPQQKESWGYTVERTAGINPTLSIKIPPKS